MDWLYNPIDARVLANGLVLWIHQNDLEVLIGGVLIDPVRVEHAEIGTAAPDAFFCRRFQRTLILQLVDTLICGLAWMPVSLNRTVRRSSRTICGAFGNRSLPSPSSHPDAVNDVTLFGLVS